jgi:hypothetical protein
LNRAAVRRDKFPRRVGLALQPPDAIQPDKIVVDFLCTARRLSCAVGRLDDVDNYRRLLDGQGVEQTGRGQGVDVGLGF